MVHNSKGDRAAFGIVVILLHAAMIAIFAGTAWYSEHTSGNELYNLQHEANTTAQLLAYAAANPSSWPFGPQCSDISDSQLCTDEFNNDFDSIFQDVHIMVFIGFGFLMTFLKKYAFSAVSVNMLVAAFACEWGALLYSYFFQFNSATQSGVMDLDTMINADFTAATVLISMGAVLGVTTPLQLLIMTLIECVLAQVNLYIGFTLLQANDPGGSMAIHTFGAYFGLSVATVLSLGNRRVPQTELEESSYTNDVFSMIGTVFLWICWPSFNGAIVHGNSRGRAILNTYLSLIGSTMMVFAVSSFVNLDEKDEKKRGRFEMMHIQNATLAGGVAMGTACNLMVTPWASLLIGTLAGLISVLGYKYLMPALRKCGVHDTCGVNNLHGMPGFFGGLAGVLFAGIATPQQYGLSLYTAFPAMAPTLNSTQYNSIIALNPNQEPGSNRTNNIQAGYQMAALAVTVGIAIFGGWITGGILRIPRIWGEISKREEYFADDVNFTVPEGYHVHEIKVDETVIFNGNSNILPMNGHKIENEPQNYNHNGELSVKF